MPWTALPAPSKRGTLLPRERAPALASPRCARMQRVKRGSHERRGGREVPGSPHPPPHRLPWKHILNKSCAWINKCVRRPVSQPALRGGRGAALHPEAWRLWPPQTPAHRAAGEGKNLTSFSPSPPQSTPQQAPQARSPLPIPAAGFPHGGHSPKGEGSSLLPANGGGGTQASAPCTGSRQAPVGAAFWGGKHAGPSPAGPVPGRVSVENQAASPVRAPGEQRHCSTPALPLHRSARCWLGKGKTNPQLPPGPG